MDVSSFAVFESSVLERKLASSLRARNLLCAVGHECVALAVQNRLVVAAVRKHTPEYQTVDDLELENDVVSCLEHVVPPDDFVWTDAASSRRQASSSGSSLSSVFCVGTERGWLRWFRSDGRLLLSHRLHDTAVRRIRGLLVLFDKTVTVLLDRDALWNALKSAANANVAGTVASAPASFPYQKFELEGQRVVNDLFACEGTDTPDPWSQFKVARSKTHIVAGGAFPMLGLYVPLEKHGRLLGLASELTSKLTSAVFSMAKSWWSSGKDVAGGPSPVKAPKIEEPRGLDMEFELSDSTREIHTLSLAPGPFASLAVACDNFGRVLLLDLELHIVVRMWKGYRDAQVGWVEQDEALFLVVYGPRRGIMEVWRMRHGQREAMMDVGTDCTLVRGGKCCYLIRPMMGQIQKVQFSAELSNHLKIDRATLEKIKMLEDRSQVMPLLRQMRHPKMLVQAVLSFSNSDSSDLFLEAVTAALEQCNTAPSDNVNSQSMLTPGAPAARVLSQDVTHLLWLDRFVRAYREVETKESSQLLSCRKFLWCFSVHGAAESRLTAAIPETTRLQLGNLLFSAKSFEKLQEALHWTRLAQADVETLLAGKHRNNAFFFFELHFFFFLSLPC